jgi:protein TonB
MSCPANSERLAKMKSILPEKRSLRGSAAPLIIVVVLVLALLGAGAWWYMNQQKGATPTAATPGAPAATTAEGEAAAPVVSAAVEELSIDQLYREARNAMSEQRVVAPAGNNAMEYYLAIIGKDPANTGAADALRELFPFASGTAEQEIIQGNLTEADRIIASLARADPSNYTLTILRSKLEARRKLIEQQEAAATAAEAAAAAAAAAAARAPATTGDAATAAAPAATGASAESPAETTAATPPPSAAPATPAAPPPPVAQGETRDVEVITPLAPSYPPQAARRRQEGWVEVEFTVNADGSVANAKVTSSDPPRVFDREAIRAVQNAKFNPRLENGVPVNSTVRRRIEFKL